MYETPVKDFLPKNTSLRQKIQSKLWTDKKFLEDKQISKKYQSNIKNPHHAKIFIQQDFQSTFQSNKVNNGSMNVTQTMQNSKITPQITQQNILEYESLQNQNFYGFNEWLQLNKKFFSHVDVNFVKVLWKIMRIINYGDVLIPSGLIFQVVNSLFCTDKKERSSLKQVFNQFLKLNNVTDRMSNFRDLKNYSSLEEVEKAYIDQSKIKRNASLQKGKSYSSLKKVDSSKDVFERNYENSKQRDQIKKKNIYKSLVQKQIESKCNFKPQINKYCPKKLFVDQNLRPQRECHSNKNWMTEIIREDDFTETYNFKALPFEKNRFQDQCLEEIPGVPQYIKRQKDSQTKKRKLQRYLQKPTQVFRND